MINGGLTNTVKGVRETKAGDLILTVENKPAGNDKAKITAALQKKLGVNNVRAPKVKPEATVHIKDIEVVATEEDVRAAILRELNNSVGAQEIQIACLRKGFAGTQNATVHLPKSAEEKLLQKRVIRIGLPSCRVVANKQIATCFKRWLPGHTATKCKGPDRSKACQERGLGKRATYGGTAKKTVPERYVEKRDTRTIRRGVNSLEKP